MHHLIVGFIFHRLVVSVTVLYDNLLQSQLGVFMYLFIYYDCTFFIIALPLQDVSSIFFVFFLSCSSFFSFITFNNLKWIWCSHFFEMLLLQNRGISRNRYHTCQIGKTVIFGIQIYFAKAPMGIIQLYYQLFIDSAAVGFFQKRNFFDFMNLKQLEKHFQILETVCIESKLCLELGIRI